MKKLLLTLPLVLLFFGLKANPVSPPPLISEIKFDGGQWVIELSNLYYSGYFQLANLDSLKLKSNTGEAFFKSGITFNANHIAIITVDSLLSPLFINSTSDEISIVNKNGLYMNDPVIFGNAYGSGPTAPTAGQSIKVVYFQFPNNKFYIVKDNQPSIGSDPFVATQHAIGHISAHLFDSVGSPVSQANIVYCGQTMSGIPENYSDSTGFFAQDLYSGRQTILIYYPSSVIQDVAQVNVEPDSTIHYDFNLNNIIVGINTYEPYTQCTFTAYPNPSASSFTINVGMPGKTGFSKGLVKIYSMSGEIVKMIPLRPAGTNGEYSVTWDGKAYDNDAPSGEYLGVLFIDGNKVATTKLMLSR